jgi:hypothetical protein
VDLTASGRPSSLFFFFFFSGDAIQKFTMARKVDAFVMARNSWSVRIPYRSPHAFFLNRFDQNSTFCGSVCLW